MGKRYTNLNTGKQWTLMREHKNDERYIVRRGMGGIIVEIIDQERCLNYDQRRPVYYQPDLFNTEPLYFFCDYCQQQVDEVHAVGFEIKNPVLPTKQADVLTCSCCQVCDDRQPPSVVVLELFSGAILERCEPWMVKEYNVDVSYKPDPNRKPLPMWKDVWTTPFKATHFYNGNLVEVKEVHDRVYYRFENRGGGSGSLGGFYGKPLEEFYGAASSWPPERPSTRGRKKKLA